MQQRLDRGPVVRRVERLLELVEPRRERTLEARTLDLDPSGRATRIELLPVELFGDDLEKALVGQRAEHHLELHEQLVGGDWFAHEPHVEVARELLVHLVVEPAIGEEQERQRLPRLRRLRTRSSPVPSASVPASTSPTSTRLLRRTR